jgi:predicted CXXCH cytochrome family protein
MHFGSQCVNCHQQPLQKVSDKACLSCHQDTAAHITDPALQKKAFNAAHRFVGTTRCAECHEEHKAPHPIAKQDNGMCVKCHGNIKAINPNTTLSNVHDFDSDHPEFKLTFKTGNNPQTITRIPQNEKARLVENSGLKFPHSQHVGKVQGPNGIWDVRELSCTTCHAAVGKEMRFTPLSFKNNCSSCHADQLTVGANELKLSVPHGDEESVFNMLKLNAPKQFSAYSDTLKTNGCAYCHNIVENKAGDAVPWRTAPLNINDDWFSKAQFNHGAHRTQQCISCHKVEDSETSADVAIPDRKSCLQCHSGNKPKHKRIASNCMSCHNFHQAHRGDALNTGEKISDKDVDVLLSINKQPK